MFNTHITLFCQIKSTYLKKASTYLNRHRKMGKLMQVHTIINPMRGSRGDYPPPQPLKITKLLGDLTIMVRIPRKPSQYSMLGHHRPASETPFKWRFAGGSIMARFYWYLDPLYPHQPKKKNNKKIKRYQRWTLLTKLSGSGRHVPREIVLFKIKSDV